MVLIAGQIWMTEWCALLPGKTFIHLFFFLLKSRKNVRFSGFKEHRQQRYDSDLEVELAIDGMALGVEQLEGVRAVAVHVAVAVRQATVAEQEGHLRKNSQWERVCMQGTT